MSSTRVLSLYPSYSSLNQRPMAASPLGLLSPNWPLHLTKPSMASFSSSYQLHSPSPRKPVSFPESYQLLCSPQSQYPLVDLSSICNEGRPSRKTQPQQKQAPLSLLSSFNALSLSSSSSSPRSSSPTSSLSSSGSLDRQQKPLPFFSPANKISVVSLERRIDFHLQRIMKQNRLINFKNSIESLPVEDRINESLLEIIASSNNLIQRRQTLIQNSLSLLTRLRTFHEQGAHADAYSLLEASLPQLKTMCSSLGQLVWALNSNKEHIKYVIKVFALPEIYVRFGPDAERIPLKNNIRAMIRSCEDIMENCTSLKDRFRETMLQVYLANINR